MTNFRALTDLLEFVDREIWPLDITDSIEVARERYSPAPGRLVLVVRNGWYTFVHDYYVETGCSVPPSGWEGVSRD